MRRVFIVWSHALFRHSAHLLLDHPQLTIVGDGESTEITPAALETLRPDTIIIEVLENDTPECSGALQFLQACYWNPRVFCVSLHDNIVRIYHCHQFTLEESQDLLHLVVDV